MKIVSIILTTMLLFFSQAAFSSNTLTRDEFTSFLKGNMPKLICEDASHVFVSCFNGMTKEQCKNTIPSLTKTCMDKVQSNFPAVLNLQQVQHWSGNIGACVGEIYKNQHKGQFKETCNKK